MANRLVYTSAPRGLKPGAFGFCVVACDRGMREQTISALEALSGYRRVYADPRDVARNPVSCCHAIFETATGRMRVLARVADAGLDYTGRTNKIASFLNVAENELTQPGPAALFSQPGLFVESWSSSDAPRYYDAPTALPNNVALPAGCEGWREATGDPAWAGILASTVATRQQVVLVVRPDQNVLRLFQEALALLPPNERWNATFSTYYMKAPPRVQIQWKAVMQGSPEEAQLRSTSGALVLDLTAPGRIPALEPLAASPGARALVDAASGRLPSPAAPPSSPSFPASQPVVPTPSAAPTPSIPDSATVSSPSTYPLQSDANPQRVPGVAPASVPRPTSPPPVGNVPVPNRKTINYGRDAVLKVSVPETRENANSAQALRLSLCIGGMLVIAAIGLSWWLLRPDYPKKINNCISIISTTYDEIDSYAERVVKFANGTKENTPSTEEINKTFDKFSPKSADEYKKKIDDNLKNAEALLCEFKSKLEKQGIVPDNDADYQKAQKNFNSENEKYKNLKNDIVELVDQLNNFKESLPTGAEGSGTQTQETNDSEDLTNQSDATEDGDKTAEKSNDSNDPDVVLNAALVFIDNFSTSEEFNNVFQKSSRSVNGYKEEVRKQKIENLANDIKETHVLNQPVPDKVDELEKLLTEEEKVTYNFKEIKEKDDKLVKKDEDRKKKIKNLVNDIKEAHGLNQPVPDKVEELEKLFVDDEEKKKYEFKELKETDDELVKKEEDRKKKIENLVNEIKEAHGLNQPVPDKVAELEKLFINDEEKKKYEFDRLLKEDNDLSENKSDDSDENEGAEGIEKEFPLLFKGFNELVFDLDKYLGDTQEGTEGGKKQRLDVSETRAVLTLESDSFYDGLNEFFRKFEQGRVTLTFSIARKKNDSVLIPCMISAEDFKNGKSKVFPEEDVPSYPGNLLIDKDGKSVKFQFENDEDEYENENVSRYLTGGIIRIEAFDDSEKRVFDPIEHMLLDGSQCEPAKTPEILSWLVKLTGKGQLSLAINEPESNSLFLEYLDDEEKDFQKVKLSIVNDSQEIKTIRNEVERIIKDNKIKINMKNVVFINSQYSGLNQNNELVNVNESVNDSEGVNDSEEEEKNNKGDNDNGNGNKGTKDKQFVIVIDFSIDNKPKIDKKIFFFQKFDSNPLTSSLSYVKNDSLIPLEVKESKLTFNIRYRTGVNQKIEDMPIIGVLNFPIYEMSPQERDKAFRRGNKGKGNQ